VSGLIRVGTSGWQYRDWRGRFYPEGLPTSRWLAHYAWRFSTVEVNASFYRLPELGTVERWAAEVPETFVLTLKASRYLTHVRRLRDPEEPLALFWERAKGAGERLGPILFQLPPDLRAEPERLASFLGALPSGLRAAFEFRHASWFSEEVLGLLDAAGAALVWADAPGGRPRLRVTGGWVYARFHQGSATAPDYPRSKLRRWAERLAAAEAAEAFVYFNNDTGGAAVRDAETLRELLIERGARCL
jgi:uncharacterized protein YecE (DUF72 family)